ncbi:MAG: hypothetical protein C0601_13340 [Candidatus Muiribacterium halophilum]|uniref:MipA/OmpV family protein n=1 Tax=Muiribacterium halophilum TaxID=2053465 RepID=A0A2N5Z9G1_MUIH1|nr:MAG: hypothetical protein C0601_13340 [Candidatus Muirbacterium halophilum]
MKKIILIIFLITFVLSGYTQKIPDFYGFMSVYKTSIFKDMDGDITFIPIPPGVGRIMTMLARPVQINISESKNILIRTHLEYYRAPYEPGDFPLSVGMEKRSGSLLTGISLKLKKNPIKLNIATDVLSKSDGTKIELFYDHSLVRTRKKSSTLQLGFKYYDKDLSDYYFGVTANEATINRNLYIADSSIIPSISYNVRQMLTPKRTLMYGVETNFYDNEIKDSPLVDESYSLRFVFGILWNK